MPRIARRAAYKAADDGFSLSLAVQQALHWPPELVHSRHTDIIAHNPLLFTLAGVSNGCPATHDQLLSSKATGYVVEYLRQNAVELGVDHVSDIAISEFQQYPSFTVTFACAKATDLLKMRPVLESLHLEYTWKILTHETVTSPSDLDNDPFSTHLALPLWTLLDQVVLRFVKNGLVKKYPLVFGHLARQFNNEMAYFQPMINSITQILRRSLDAAFRSQCKRLIKILERRLTTVSDFDREIENPDHEEPQQLDLTKAAFFLAMRLVFKASMKAVEFRGYTHTIDVEDQEFLETSPARPTITCLLPSEDIFLEQDDGDTRPFPEELSPFDMLDSLQFGGGSHHARVSSTDALPMDTDSEDESYMFDFSGDCFCDIGLDLDGSDEELSPWTSVTSSVGQSGESLPSCIGSSQSSDESPGNAYLSQTQDRDRIYTESELRPMPSTGDRNTQEPFRGTTSTESHTTLQARSGDIGASQANSELNQMGHLEGWRLQVARNGSRTEVSTASAALDLEFPLDMDDDYVDIDDKIPSFCQPYILEDYGRHCSRANMTNHGFDHEDFLDVISEELLSDEELDMDGLFDREGAICQIKMELGKEGWDMIDDRSCHWINTDFMELAM